MTVRPSLSARIVLQVTLVRNSEVRRQLSMTLEHNKVRRSIFASQWAISPRFCFHFGFQLTNVRCVQLGEKAGGGAQGD